MKVTPQGLALAAAAVFAFVAILAFTGFSYLDRQAAAGDCGISLDYASSEAKNFVTVHSQELGLPSFGQGGSLSLVSSEGSCFYDFSYIVGQNSVDVTVYDDAPHGIGVTSGALAAKASGVQ